jgi:hypothetical protein
MNRIVANIKIKPVVVSEYYSKPTGLPLILVALPEHHSLLQKVSKNLMLLPNRISVNPESISTDKLINMACKIMEQEYMLSLDKLVERVDTLIVEADRMIVARITKLTIPE